MFRRKAGGVTRNPGIGASASGCSLRAIPIYVNHSASSTICSRIAVTSSRSRLGYKIQERSFGARPKSVSSPIAFIQTHAIRTQRRFQSTTNTPKPTSPAPDTKVVKKPWWRNMSADFKVALWSYLVMGTTGWIFLGTTTLVSVILWSANTLKAQGLVADMVSNYLTRRTGLSISFETAIVPRWKEGRLRLSNVKVEISEADALKWNCSEVHLFIKEIDVKLSANWLLAGKGLLSELLVKGVSGSVDRRRIDWDRVPPSSTLPERNGFVFEKCMIEDAHVVIHNPRPDRPLLLDIFSLQCKIMRSAYLLQDLLYAEYVHGSFDDCLFTLTNDYKFEPKLLRRGMQALQEHEELEEEEETSKDYIKKILKISGVSIDHISETATGPVSWLTRGTIDLRLELFLPKMDFEELLNQAGRPLQHSGGGNPSTLPATTTHFKDDDTEDEEVVQKSPPKDIKMKYEVVLQNLSAEVPLSTPHLSYLKSALIQPVVLYLNTNYTVFPMEFSFSIPQSNFKNAWYPGDVGFWTAISEASGMAIVDIVREKRNSKNLWEMLYYGGDGVIRGVRYCWLYFVKSFFALPPSLN